VPPKLLLSAVHAGQSGYGGQDEAFQVSNVSTGRLVLTDAWQVAEDSGRVVAFPSSGITLEAGSRAWCARDARLFVSTFGFTPALEYGVDSSPHVPNMSLNGAFRLPDTGGWLYLYRAVRSDTVNVDEGPWPAGDNETRSSMERRDPALPDDDENWMTAQSSTVGVDAKGNAIVGTPGHTNSVYTPGQGTATGVVINEVAWAGTFASHYDEWIELYNNSDQDVDLRGWMLVAADGTPAIQLEGSIPPEGFYLLERTDDGTIANVPADHIYTGALENAGESLHLYGAEVVDSIAYGSVATLPPGWEGSPLAFYGNNRFSLSGQLLFRKHSETTGVAFPDTDTAADWANSTWRGELLYGPVAEGDVFGKRVLYPGWDWGPVLGHTVYTETFSVAATARVTVVVAPDNAYAALADLLRSAQRDILVGAYSFESIWLTRVLTERLAAGVAVTMFLEGAPAGGLTDAELWNCRQIVDAGGQVSFMHNDSVEHIYDRYRYYHAKYAIIDGRWMAVGSENFGNHAMPVDDKANGTAGDRGVFLITDQAEVVDYVRDLFKRDSDPVYHRDVVGYRKAPSYVVPPSYTPVYSTGGGGYDYMAPFSGTAPVFETDYLEVVHAPETSLRYGDGLIGLVLRAGEGDKVLVEQMHEPLHWGSSSSHVSTDPNLRLEAYIQAARNGASVRVLLDKGLDTDRKNYDTAFYILEVAHGEGLDLDVRLGNPTGRGIHNKMVLVRLGEEGYVHVGSINGSEVSSKVNRELALQVRSLGAYRFLSKVFEYDWAHSGGPFETRLPILRNQYVPESDHVVISELVFKVSGADEAGEWIELYNPTAEAIDVSGWRLGDAVHQEDYERCYAFPAGTILPPGETLVVAHRAAAYQDASYPSKPVPDYEWRDSNQVPNLIRTTWGEGELMLGNAGDEVLLLDASQGVVDVMVYGNGVYPGTASFGDVSEVFNGNSLERRPANRDSDDCSRDFRVRYAPDPGNQDSW
jgi:phosphatidylserine/phosphatidylglycerophosphate/cardiolipin synthase-like enzyme